MIVTVPLADGRTLRAEADRVVADAARELLDRAAAQAADLAVDETAVAELDWARLRLQAGAETVEATEPDAPSITRTGRILAAQARLLRELGVAGLPLRAGQYSRVSVDALEAPAVTAQRSDDPDPLFSGWQVEAAGAANLTHGLFSTEEIVELHPSWLPALALPSGWSFRLDNAVIAECRSPDGKIYSLDMTLPDV